MMEQQQKPLVKVMDFDLEYIKKHNIDFEYKKKVVEAAICIFEYMKEHGVYFPEAPAALRIMEEDEALNYLFSKYVYAERAARKQLQEEANSNVTNEQEPMNAPRPVTVEQPTPVQPQPVPKTDEEIRSRVAKDAIVFSPVDGKTQIFFKAKGKPGPHKKCSEDYEHMVIKAIHCPEPASCSLKTGNEAIDKTLGVVYGPSLEERKDYPAIWDKMKETMSRNPEARPCYEYMFGELHPMFMNQGPILPPLTPTAIPDLKKGFNINVAKLVQQDPSLGYIWQQAQAEFGRKYGRLNPRFLAWITPHVFTRAYGDLPDDYAIHPYYEQPRFPYYDPRLTIPNCPKILPQGWEKTLPPQLLAQYKQRIFQPQQQQPQQLGNIKTYSLADGAIPIVQESNENAPTYGMADGAIPKMIPEEEYMLSPIPNYVGRYDLPKDPDLSKKDPALELLESRPRYHVTLMSELESLIPQDPVPKCEYQIAMAQAPPKPMSPIELFLANSALYMVDSMIRPKTPKVIQVDPKKEEVKEEQPPQYREDGTRIIPQPKLRRAVIHPQAPPPPLSPGAHKIVFPKLNRVTSLPGSIPNISNGDESNGGDSNTSSTRPPERFLAKRLPSPEEINAMQQQLKNFTDANGNF